MRRKGIHSVWAPAFQEGSHVGRAGFGVVSLRGAPVSMPSFATAAFRRFFDLGRLVRCVLPLGNGRAMHLVVVYGALCDLAVVGRGQPLLLLVTSTLNPPRFLVC